MSPEMKEKLRLYEEHLAQKGYTGNAMRTMIGDARRFALFMEGKELEKGQRTDED